jgi:hypothetical protein
LSVVTSTGAGPYRRARGEEPARGGGVPLLGQQHVDDLPVLVDRPIQVLPPASDLQVGLVDEPAVAGRVPERPGGIGEQRRESLHPEGCKYGDRRVWSCLRAASRPAAGREK